MRAGDRRAQRRGSQEQYFYDAIRYPMQEEEHSTITANRYLSRVRECTNKRDVDVPRYATEGMGEGGVDLFSHNNKDYLVTTDYKSNFWEIDHLPNTSSKTVIHKLKAHFARHGIPDTVVSDNGPQFSSSDFTHFSTKYGFEHTPSSPHYSRSNGKAESSVKSAKKMIRKTTKSGEVQYMALLNIRNTPTQGIDSSPAQRILGRRTKTILPTARSLLESRSSITRQETEQRQLMQKTSALLRQIFTRPSCVA